MLLNLFQIIFLVFAFFSTSKIYIQFKSNKLKLTEVLFWLLIWLLGGFIVISPESSTKIGNYLGIKRGADFIIYISVITLFYLSYKMYLKVEGLNRKIKKLTTKITIRDHKLTKK